VGLKVRDILEELEKLAPTSLAEDWDNVGLLVGSPEAEVKGIYVCLDVDLTVLREAVDQGCNVILSHHPVIYKPLRQIRYDESQGELLSTAIEKKLHLIAAHTNYDNAVLGVSHQLALKIGLHKIQVLMPKEEKLYKLVVFVPEGHEEVVRKALGDAGAGHIGNYSHCTFASPGTGTFLPLEGTQPFIGLRGQLEKVAEARMETIVPHGILNRVLQAMLTAHPYEEVAYDLIPLANESQKGGLGCFGVLPEPKTLAEFANDLKEKLGVNGIKVAGEPNKPVEKIAVCGGAGKIALNRALALGVDVLVTGELGHHDAQFALQHGMALIDAGHFATESVALPFLVSYLKEQLNLDSAQVVLGKSEKDLWSYV
jgi:dinuclear metal center YbgI/SA1388 family protein